MIALLQRVRQASVRVNGASVGQIGVGLLVYVAFVPEDDEACVTNLLNRLLKYRVFADDGGRMNLSLRDIEGQLLLVPQFTLAAKTATGSRPGFSAAAPAAQAKRLFEHSVAVVMALMPGVQTGRFGTDMQVASINDGPVTLWLES